MPIGVKESSFDRWVDIASVVVISAAAVLTAWCGYESARWTTDQTREYNQASALRMEAGAAAARSNALETIDVTMFLHYVNAVATNDAVARDFIYRRFRPEMKRAVEAWVATKPLKNRSAPSSPFAMSQYRLRTEDEARRLNAQAAATFKNGSAANELADGYVRLTVIFAAVSFLGGISTKFRFPSHIVVISAGCCVLIFGLIQLLGLPV